MCKLCDLGLSRLHRHSKSRRGFLRATGAAGGEVMALLASQPAA